MNEQTKPIPTLDEVETLRRTKTEAFDDRLSALYGVMVRARAVLDELESEEYDARVMRYARALRAALDDYQVVDVRYGQAVRASHEAFCAHHGIPAVLPVIK